MCKCTLWGKGCRIRTQTVYVGIFLDNKYYVVWQIRALWFKPEFNSFFSYVLSPQTPIAYRGMNKPFDANVSDKVISVNNSAVILSECLNLTLTFFHVLQVSPVIISHNWHYLMVKIILEILTSPVSSLKGVVEECHLHYIVAGKEWFS